MACPQPSGKRPANTQPERPSARPNRARDPSQPGRCTSKSSGTLGRRHSRSGKDSSGPHPEAPVLRAPGTCGRSSCPRSRPLCQATFWSRRSSRWRTSGPGSESPRRCWRCQTSSSSGSRRARTSGLSSPTATPPRVRRPWLSIAIGTGRPRGVAFRIAAVGHVSFCSVCACQLRSKVAS